MPVGYEEELQEETLNMQFVTMEEFTEFVRDAIEMENFDTPILCLGKSGIGKTESIENDVTKPLGIGLIELRLASYNETDLVGVPYFVEGKREGTKYTKFADMNILPHLASTGEGNSPDVGVLLFDEMTATSRNVRAVALQLMDKSRSIGDYKLPPKWLIVVLGNGPTDGGMYNGLEYAIISRAMCLRVKPDFQSWKSWALRNGVHPTVISFIQQHGGTSMLHRIKSTMSGGYEEKECNPRSWVKLSTCLYKKEARAGGMLSERQVQIYAGAAVGSDLAIEFATYYANKADLVPIEKILSGEALKIDPSSLKMETLYMGESVLVNQFTELVERNERYISNDELPPKADMDKICNIIKWVLHIEPRKVDLAIETIHDFSKSSPNFVNLMLIDGFDDLLPEYIEFITKRRGLNDITANMYQKLSEK